MTIGEKIKAIRKSKRMTQKQLAEKLGISYQAIQQIENKDNINTNTLQKIASALNVPISELLKYSCNAVFSEHNLQQSSCVNELLTVFNNFNALGQKVALERLQELSQIKKYTNNK